MVGRARTVGFLPDDRQGILEHVFYRLEKPCASGPVDHAVIATHCHPHAAANVHFAVVHDRLRDNANPFTLNLMKGGIVYSNFVTTVSPIMRRTP